MVKSADRFYKELGTKGLAVRKKEIHTRKELAYLKKILPKKRRILDLACGYGRFTIPLAKEGYEIEGIDISPNLLRKARRDAKKENVRIKFRRGDMRYLPYENNSFGTIICMWSSFIELNKKSDQIRAVKEMLRVLEPGGLTFLEMSYIIRNSNILTQKGVRKIKDNVAYGVVDGITHNPHYIHSKKTLRDLMKEVGVKRYNVFIDDFGGRKRLLVKFWNI